RERPVGTLGCERDGRRKRESQDAKQVFHGIPLLAACVVRAVRHCGAAPRESQPPQYVARPPERSNTAPVLNEHSSLASQATSAAISCGSPKRPIGIFDSM